jgi:hypothetical protein
MSAEGGMALVGDVFTSEALILKTSISLHQSYIVLDILWANLQAGLTILRLPVLYRSCALI